MMNATTDRLPPHDIEAEECTVAAMLVDPEVIADIVGLVQPQHFFREKNGWVYSAILDLSTRHDEVNQITVAHELAIHGRLEDVGGQTYLSDIIHRLPTPAGAAFYADIVRRCATYRELARAGYEIERMAYDASPDVPASLARAEELLARVSVQRQRQATRTVGEVLAGPSGEGKDGLEAEIDAFLDDPEAIRGVATGWHELDTLLGGLRPARLYTVLGDTSVGKSAFVQFLVSSLGKRDIPVHLVSTEMSAEEVTERMVYMLAGVDPEHIRRNGATTGHRNAIERAVDIMRGWPVHVTDVGEISLGVLLSEVRRHVSAYQVQAVFVDHIDQVHVAGLDRRLEVGAVIAALKGVAMNESVPVVQVSHINRAAAGGPIGKHAGKETSDVEQVSNVQIALEAVEYTESGWQLLDEEAAAQQLRTHNRVAVKVRTNKNRGGRLAFDVRWLDWDRGGQFVPVLRGER